MRTILFGLCLCLSVLTPKAYSEPSVSGDEDADNGELAPSDPNAQGVAGGGAGGLPNGATVGTSSVGIMSVGPGSDDDLEVVTPQVEGPKIGTTSLHPRPKPTTVAPQPDQVVLDREQMLEAINAALNKTDLEMNIEEQAATVRILSIDLKSATLHGRVLESNKPILLIDKTKKSIRK